MGVEGIGGGLEGGVWDRNGMKIWRLQRRRDFLGEKNNFERLEKTFREEEEDGWCKVFIAKVKTCVKACLRRNEVKKLEANLVISVLTRSTQAERLEGCTEGIRVEGTYTDKDSII